MKRIWNTFCEEICRNKGVKEMTFEKEIVKSFLQALGWSRYDGNLEEQYGLYSRKWIPDFVFYLNNDKSAKEIILELKKPDHKQRKVDIEQIEAYMKLTDCRLGLYFGEKLEVFYLLEKDGKRSAESVITIDWTNDNEAGTNLIELLNYRQYDRNKLEKFCLDHVKLNSCIKNWKTALGQRGLYDAIMKHFMLPPAMGSSLQARLKFHIVDNSDDKSKSLPVTVLPTAPQGSNGQSKIWLICYDNESFDVEKCFKKLGKVYWKHSNSLVNVQKGDIAYLYASAPKSSVRYKVEIVDSQLPYSPIMDEENEFLKSGSSNSDNSKYLFFLVRPLAESESPALKHAMLKRKGLMGKRPSTTILSKEEHTPLREYIEQHFDDAATANESVVPMLVKKVKPNKQFNLRNKADRRPPFKFSMIGLMPGDVVYFKHGNIPVTVISENAVTYDGEIYTLSRFCKHFMPNEGSENKAYQGPTYFLHNGRTLDDIRKEKEKEKK